MLKQSCVISKKNNPLQRSPRIAIFILAALCWIAALTHILLTSSTDSPLLSENTLPAYSGTSPVYKVNNCRLLPVANNTYELFLSDVPYNDTFSKCSDLLHDTSLQCIFSHSETTYDDYYFYSPVLEEAGYSRTSGGYNLHMAVTKSGHTYLGFPQIAYDF
ncbi:MAG: hypothetical protein J1E62_04400 [Lachnospiraceae bacterium]|nr:hypothetical protein [Lachnospiraceae bacterium]